MPSHPERVRSNYPMPLTFTERQAEALRLFKTAAQKFIDKVESGRARSVETYADMKAALDYANGAGL